MMSGRREALLLCTFCLYMCSFAPFCVASMPWTCSLQYAPVEKIPLPTQQDLLSKESLDGGRRLRLRNAAIVLHRRGYTERETRADSLDDGVNRTSIENTIEGRECTCTGMLPTTAKFYCPTPTDHCSVWVRSYSNEYGVNSIPCSRLGGVADAAKRRSHLIRPHACPGPNSSQARHLARKEVK